MTQQEIDAKKLILARSIIYSLNTNLPSIDSLLTSESGSGESEKISISKEVAIHVRTVIDDFLTF